MLVIGVFVVDICQVVLSCTLSRQSVAFHKERLILILRRVHLGCVCVHVNLVSRGRGILLLLTKSASLDLPVLAPNALFDAVKHLFVMLHVLLVVLQA